MKTVETSQEVHKIARKPELIFLETGKIAKENYESYQILEIKSGITRGEDHHGRYRSVSNHDVVLYLYENDEEKRDHMIGLADKRDDNFEFNTLSSGDL